MNCLDSFFQLLTDTGNEMLHIAYMDWTNKNPKYAWVLP